MPTLIIAEKPNAAQKIALALGTSGSADPECLERDRSKMPKRHKSGKAVWYELTRGNEKIIVAPSVGHIFSLKKFDIEWLPSFEVSKGSAFTNAYYKNLEKAAKRCDSFIIATDFDTEGSVIGYNILKHICGRDDARRMKFSTLTEDELREAYENAGPLDTPQIEAGLARHVLDWLWGINTSRALTKAVNLSGKGFTVLSTGRVQGPALKILVEREREIRAFKPEPFWELEADVEIEDGALTTYHEKEKFWDKAEAERVRGSCGDEARVASIEKREYEQAPPTPFGLTSLQIEAHGVLGISPANALSLAQSL